MLTPKAAALKYDAAKNDAPQVIASGRGEIALKIIEKAKSFDVPIFQNPALADALLKQEVGSEIDPQLLQAVAEVFVWLMRTEAKAQVSK